MLHIHDICRNSSGHVHNDCNGRNGCDKHSGHCGHYGEHHDAVDLEHGVLEFDNGCSHDERHVLHGCLLCASADGSLCDCHCCGVYFERLPS